MSSSDIIIYLILTLGDTTKLKGVRPSALGDSWFIQRKIFHRRKKRTIRGEVQREKCECVCEFGGVCSDVLHRLLRIILF